MRGLAGRSRCVVTTWHVITVLATFALGACAPPPGPTPAETPQDSDTPQERLEDGMLIFRAGRGPEAESVRTAQRGRIWTHVGILAVDGVSVTVVHAVPSEVPGRADGVVEDPLAFFVASERATGHAIFRLAGATAAQGAAAVSSARTFLGHPFGVSDARHEDRMICTSLVLAAWSAVPGAPVLHPKSVRLPLAPPGVVLPADLAAVPELVEVARSLR